jgi:hypothetical protein
LCSKNDSQSHHSPAALPQYSIIYQHRTDEIQIATKVAGDNDEEVTQEQTDQNHEYLHESGVEVAHHVELRAALLGADSRPTNRAACSAEWIAIHDCA